MPRRRLYRGLTVVFAFRMSRESRGLLESLAARAGTTPAHYMREVWEDHLRSEGYDLSSGAEAVLDPDADTPAGWRRRHGREDDR